jgi:hypothetical protein
MNAKCPECSLGDIDIATPGDGRWDVQWTPVQCDVGSSTFVYSFEGSNAFYLKMRVANTRVPLAKVEIITADGNFVEMTRTQDNAFLYAAASPIPLPAGVRLTSVLGVSVLDQVPTTDPATTVPVQGAAQFPVNPAVPVVSNNGTPTARQESAPETPVPVTQAPNAPVPNTSTPNVPTAPGTCTSPLRPYAQCGGISRGGIDAPDTTTCCPIGDTCVRQNQYYYQCLKGASAQSESDLTQLPPNAVCGGYDVQTDKTFNGQFQNTTCTDNFVCTQKTQTVWTCDPIPVVRCAP